MREKRYKAAVIFLTGLVLLEAAVIIFLWASRPRRVVRVPVPLKGKIAIVIDDWGYNLNNLSAAEEIRYPFTAAILPGLPYSRRVAEELRRLGYEIILHMPMQPRERARLEANTLMAGDSPATIKEKLRRALDNLAYAKGVSNHMGSAVTEDAKTVSALFAELKRRRLYFLDSYVIPDSLCAPLARQAGIGFARRDIFLDNNNDPRYIRQQLYRLAQKARKNGSAVGICHDRRTSIVVLKEVMPLLAREGYRFVFLSELVK
jgi:polysaccharide deacetylase 2 family uncharacterized protein YibQ